MGTSKLTVLPSYDQPPLIEVAIGVGFKTKSVINAGHLGVFWSRVRDKFPSMQSLQPITVRTEDAKAKWTPPSIQFAFSNKPDCRLQMTSEDDDAWMWQVQSDRLVVNWRKRPDSDYPRYSVTLQKFKEAWLEWSGCLDELAISDLSPTSWELTYVNEIPSGEDELWRSPSQWPDILPGLFGNRFLAEKGLDLAGLHGEWVWKQDSPAAHLIVTPAPAKRTERGHVLMVSLTAKGPVAEGESLTDSVDKLKAYEAGLNLGHRLIVNTFDLLGSKAAKMHWRRNENR